MPVRWIAKRNCSTGPTSLVGASASLGAVVCAIGAGFASLSGLWLVLPFASVETVAGDNAEASVVRVGVLGKRGAIGQHAHRYGGLHWTVR